MSAYPDTAKLRMGLVYAKDHPTWTCDDFIDEAELVCSEPADSKTDIQRIAVLKFIEKVLNG